MKPNILQQLESWIKSQYALLMCLACIIIVLIPTQISFLNFKPDLLLTAVYFWAVHKPEDLSIAKIFSLGLFVDLLEGYLIGINALTLLLTFIITRDLRRFIMGKPFIISLWGMVVIALGAFTIKWFLVVINQNMFISFKSTLISYILTVLFYPVIGLIGAKIYSAGLKD